MNVDLNYWSIGRGCIAVFLFLLVMEVEHLGNQLAAAMDRQTNICGAR